MVDLSRLKICFIVGTLGQGGAERQLYYLVKELYNCGTQLLILSLTRNEFWEAKIRELGIPIHWVGKSHSWFIRLATIIRILRGKKYDYVYSQHFFTNLYACFAAKAIRSIGIGSLRSNCINEVQSLGPHCWACKLANS